MARLVFLLNLISVILGLISVACSRTSDDVINDFEPVFVQLHGNFSSMENLATGNAIQILNDMRQTISDENNIDRTALAQAQEEIKKNISDILHQAGLDHGEEIVKKCLDAESLAVSDLLQQNLGGLRVCNQLWQQAVTSCENSTKILYGKIKSEHIILEATRTECRRIGTPFDVQTCLIRDLYLYYPTYIIEATKAVEHEIESWRKDLTELKKNIESCGYFIRRNILVDSTELVGNFKKCVEAIRS